MIGRAVGSGDFGNGSELLFTDKDVGKLRPLYQRVKYETPIDIAPGVEARWVESGHIFGSASIDTSLAPNALG